MNALRLPLTLCAALAVVAGCGGSQPPIGAPGAMPQSATTQARAHRATSSDLIYATNGCGGICVVSYPQGELVDSIKVSGGLGGACSDASGNVFVTHDSQVLEYSHGGTTPIATLNLPGTDSYACSVDPMTNNLAVVLASTGSDVAVFANEGGSPTVYSSKIDSFYCGYDNGGNLFVSGQVSGNVALSELASGQSTFFRLSIDGTLGLPGQVQWDGSHITVQNRDVGHPSISQLSVSGSVATVVKTVRLRGKTNRTNLSWIYDGQVLVPFSTGRDRLKKIAIWRYPRGGKRSSIIHFKNANAWDIEAVTVSVAPSS